MLRKADSSVCDAEKFCERQRKEKIHSNMHDIRNFTESLGLEYESEAFSQICMGKVQPQIALKQINH